MTYPLQSGAEGLGKIGTSHEPELVRPDRSKCLECAFGKLLASSDVRSAERAQAEELIDVARSTSTTSTYTRATIYRCGAIGCDHALMTITNVAQPMLPEDVADISLLQVPGSSGCTLPNDQLTRDI